MRALKPPTISDSGTWFPGPDECLVGTLLDIRGISYDFAATQVYPLLTVELIDDHVPSLHVEVHTFSTNLRAELYAARPPIGSRILIETDDSSPFVQYRVNPNGTVPGPRPWGRREGTPTEYCTFSAYRRPDVPDVPEDPDPTQLDLPSFYPEGLPE